MALQAYLSLKGKKQGDIKGSVTQMGREGKIAVIAVSHAIVSPRDPATGKATGKRMHKPLVITKELDKSSPLLYNALVHNETISDLELQFYTSTLGTAQGLGSEVNHYTVRLLNATIASIDFSLLNNKREGNMNIPECEDVAFTYQKITWTWNDGGISAEDDWEAPV